MRRINLLVTTLTLILYGFQDTVCLGLPQQRSLAFDLRETSAGHFLKANLVPWYLQGFLSDRNATNSLTYLNQLSPMCRPHYMEWLTEIQNNYNELANAESWALQMIDAWGKAPEGLLSGHVNALGDFDECLKVRRHHESQEGYKFRGKYCTNYLTFSVSNEPKVISPGDGGGRSISELMELLDAMGRSDTPITPSVASCLPSTCSDQDVQIIITSIFSSSDLTNYGNPITVICSTDEKPPLSIGSIVMIVILALLLSLVTIGSIMDILRRYEYFNHGHQISTDGTKEKCTKIFLAFSIVTNTEKLLSTNTPAGNLGCLHGIRFLSATWVILGHTFYMYVIQDLWNIVDMVKAPQENLLLLVVLNNSVVVDTFLTLSGILVSYNILKTLDKDNGKLNVPLMYISRYFRLTPIYALVIGFAATLFPYFSFGPKWFVVDLWARFCQKNWWKNLLYINNLPIYNKSSPDDVLCYGESWYLGADMQLFIMSPLFVYPLWKWKRAGILFLSIGTLISIIVPFTKIYIDNLPPTFLHFRESGEYILQSYMPTWMRASPYLIGLWTGFFLYKTQRSFKMPRLIMFACWLIAISSALAVLLGIQKYFDWRYEIPRLEGAFYAGFHRAIWAICIAWLIFACVRGYGGWVNLFLSWKVFIPLGRLSYAIYLVSFHLQFLLHYSYKQPIYYSGYNMINISFSHLVMSLIVAFLFSLIMEVPFMELEKMILKKNARERPSQQRLNDSEVYRNYGSETVENSASVLASNK